ncbi:OadG-related small transporter subunit [Alloiococcus sp. CFN-8]
MNINENLPAFFDGLKLMVFGMIGIFLVLTIIFFSIKVLLKVFPPK